MLSKEEFLKKKSEQEATNQPMSKEEFLAKKNQYQTDKANKLNEYISNAKNDPDFFQLSMGGNMDRGALWKLDKSNYTRYNFINDIGGLRNAYNKNLQKGSSAIGGISESIMYGNKEDWDALNAMNNDQRSMYTYLHNKHGIDVADQYYESIYNDLSNRGKIDRGFQTKYGAETSPFEASVGSVAADTVSGAGYLASVIGKAFGSDVENWDFNKFIQRGQQDRANVGDMIERNNPNSNAGMLGNLPRLLYDSGMSAIDSLVASGIAYGIGEAANVGNLQKFSEIGTNIIMSSSAAQSGYLNALQEGKDNGRAFIDSFVGGAIEYATETIPLHTYFDNAMKESVDKSVGKAIKTGIKNILMQAGSEGIEEFAGTAMEDLYDAIASSITGEESEYEQYYNNLLSQGMSEEDAYKQTWQYALSKYVQSTASGALSGAMMSAPSEISRVGSSAAYNSGMFDKANGRQIIAQNTSGKRVGSVISDARQTATSTGNTALMELAKQAQKNQNDAKLLGKLERMNSDAKRMGSYNSYMQEATKKLIENGYSESDAKTLADALYKESNGYNLVDSEEELIEKYRANEQSVDKENRLNIEQSVAKANDSSVTFNQKESARIAYENASVENTRLNVTIDNNGAKVDTEIESIDSIGKDGKVKVKLKNGMVVESSTLNNRNLDKLIDAGNAMFNGYQNKEQILKGMLKAFQSSTKTTGNVDVFVANYVSTYLAGAKNNASLEEIKKEAKESGLSEFAIEMAFNQGKELTKNFNARIDSQINDRNTDRNVGSNLGNSNSYLDVSMLDDADLTQKQMEQIQVIETIANAIQVPVHLYQSAVKDGRYVGMNGAYNHGEIYIDVNAGIEEVATKEEMRTYLMLKTMSHELTHFIAANNKEGYKALRDYTMNELERITGRSRYELVNARMENAKYSGMTLTAQAEEEIVAESCDLAIGDSRFIQDVCDTNKSLAKTIIDHLKSILKKIKNFLTGAKNDSYSGALKNAENVYDKLVSLWDAGLKGALDGRTNVQSVNYMFDKNGNLITMLDANGEISEEVKKLRQKVLQEAKNQVIESNSTLQRLDAVMNATDGNGSPTMAQWRSFKDVDEREKYQKMLEKAHFKDADKLMNMIDFIIDTYIKLNEDALDFGGEELYQEYKQYMKAKQDLRDKIAKAKTENEKFKLRLELEKLQDPRAFSPAKPNSDKLYIWSLDYSTLCRKRITQTIVKDALEKQLKRSITREESTVIREQLQQLKQSLKTLEVACGLCYVESARSKSYGQIKKFLTNPREFLTKQLAKQSLQSKSEVEQAKNAVLEKYKSDLIPLVKSLAEDKNVAPKSRAKYQKAIDSGDDITIMKSLSKAVLKANGFGYIADEVYYAGDSARLNYKLSEKENKFIMDAERIAKESPETFTTVDGLKKLAKTNRQLYNMYSNCVSAATRSKGIEDDTFWMAGDLDSIGDAMISAMNKENGSRSQSWSDFQVKHILDYIAATIELASRDAKMHAYTKVPDFVILQGRTNEMINMSLIPTKIFNGQLDFDPIEGMEIEIAKKLRDQFPETAGTICIGINDQQIILLMESDFIDYIIPYHASGMPKSLYSHYNIPGWTSYQNVQGEKKADNAESYVKGKKYKAVENGKIVEKDAKYVSNIDPDGKEYKEVKFSEWFILEEVKQNEKLFGATMAMRLAAEKYKSICYERGLMPKFSYTDSNSKTDFSKYDNYWKLLIDRKMINQKTNTIIEQKALVPNYQLEGEYGIEGILKRELERYPQVIKERDFAVNTIVNNFMSGKYDNLIKNANLPVTAKYESELEKLGEEDRKQYDDLFNFIQESQDAGNNYGIAKESENHTMASFRGESTISKDKFNEAYKDYLQLDQAKEMDKKGVDKKTIYKETGWFKGKDGNWRTEINDSVATFDLDGVKKLFHTNKELLPNILNHPELYKQYKFLKKVEVNFKELGKGVVGYADTLNYGITLNAMYKGLFNKDRMKSSLLHEIQHLIQDYEGFDRGADATKVSAKEYNNANGEIESRTVESRMNMSMEERLANAPETMFSTRDSNGNELSKAQQEYFKDSKIRDENGNLLVVYHGTNSEFYTFDIVKAGKNGRSKGYGYYLTPNKTMANHYGDRVINAYVAINRPMNNEKKTISFVETKKLIAQVLEDKLVRYDDIDWKDSFISNYVYTYDNGMTKSRAISEMARMIYDANENDSDVIYEVAIAAGMNDNPSGARMFYESLTKATGFDGGVYGDEIVAFHPNQIKSIDNQNPTSNEDIRFSVRKEPAPTNTKKAYKLMRYENGHLYPLFIGNNEQIDIGTWYNADSPNLGDLKKMPTGTNLVNMADGSFITWEQYAKENGISRTKPNKDDVHWANENGYRFMYIEDKSNSASENRMLKQYGDTRAYYNWGVNGSSKSKNGEGSASIYALRPGWHFGEIPSMRQIGYDGGDGEDVRLDNQVWVEVEMSADVDYSEEAKRNYSGDIPDHIPTNGYYTFATNPTQKKTKLGNTSNDKTKADWYVAGAFKVVRIISDSEADAIVNNFNQKNGANVPLDYRRKDGRVFNADTLQLEDNTMFSRRDESHPRYILANALMSVAKTEEEREMLRKYKDNVTRKNNLEVKYNDLQKQIESGDLRGNELSQAKTRMARIQTNIQNFDKQLLSLENEKVLRDVMKRDISKANAEVAKQARIDARKEFMSKQRDIKERQEAKKRKDYIVDFVEKTQKAMLNPKEKTFIPRTMREPITYLLGSINTIMSNEDSIYELDQKITSLCEQIESATGIDKEILQNKMEKLKLRRDNKVKLKEDVVNRLNQFKIAYQESINTDEDAKETQVVTLIPIIDNIMNVIGDKALVDLDSEQVELLYRLCKVIETNIVNERKMFFAGKRMVAGEVALSLVDDMVEQKENPLIAQDSPETVFDAIGGYKKNNAWLGLYDMLNEGQKKQSKIMMETMQMFDELLSDYDNKLTLHKHSKTKNELVSAHMIDANGNEIMISKGMRISLYMSLADKGNVQHAMFGGITFPEMNGYYGGRMRGRDVAKSFEGVGTVISDTSDFKRSISTLRSQLISCENALKDTKDAGEIAKLEYKKRALENEIEALVEQAMQKAQSIRDMLYKDMTEYEKKWCETTDKYFNEYSKDVVNEATEEAYGYGKANTEHYFPITVDKNYLNDSVGRKTFATSFNGVGILVDRIFSTAPIYMYDITDIIERHTKSIADIGGMLNPINNYNAIMNYNGSVDDGEEDYRKVNLKESLSKAGKGGIQKKRYLNTLVRDLVGNPVHSGKTSFGLILNNVVASTFMVNFGVMAKQAASYPSASPIIGSKYLVKATKNFVSMDKGTFEKICKYSPLLYIRSRGYSSSEMNSVRTLLDKAENGKVMKQLMNLCTAMDMRTVSTLWYACEYKIEEEMPGLTKGSKEFYTEVAKVFDKAIEETQPNWTLMQRPEIMRDSSEITKLVFAIFKTQPFQNYNLIKRSAMRYKAALNGGNASDIASAKKNLASTITSQVMSNLMLTAINLALKLVRHDLDYFKDDDEASAGSIIWAIVNNFFSSSTGMVMGLDKLYTIIESCITGDYMGNVADIMSISALNDIATKFRSVVRGSASAKTITGLICDMLDVVGIPASNVKRIANDIYEWCVEFTS